MPKGCKLRLKPGERVRLLKAKTWSPKGGPVVEAPTGAVLEFVKKGTFKGYINFKCDLVPSGWLSVLESDVERIEETDDGSQAGR